MYRFEVKEQGRKQTISYTRKEAISFAHQIGIDFENDTEYRWFLNQALQCTLPLGWKKEYDPLGLIQYHNTATNTVTDKHPLLFKFRKAFALLSSQRNMDQMSYEAQHAAFLNLISSIHSEDHSETDVDAFTYYELLLNNSAEIPSHILESLDYQLVDPQEMLNAAEELGVRHDYRYMWLARMLVVLPLPPLWTVEDNEGGKVYQSPSLVPYATRPAVPYLRSLIKQGGLAKKSFLMEFHDKDLCKYQVDLRRLVGGIDFIIYKEHTPDLALKHLVPDKGLTIQEQYEKLIVFEIINAVGIDINKEIHMLIGAFVFLDHLRKDPEFRDWEFRFTSEGKSYWYNHRFKQAKKTPPFKKQAIDFLKQYRSNSLNSAKELVKSYAQRHTLFEISGKTLFEKARAEAIGMVKTLIDKQTDSYYEFYQVSEYIKKQFKTIDTEKLLNFLFAIPFEINLENEEPKPFWEESSEEISTSRVDRIDPIVRGERIYRMKTINESQFSALERQSRYLRSKSIIEDVSDEEDEDDEDEDEDRPEKEQSGVMELDDSPLGKYSEIQTKIQTEEEKDFMRAIHKHLENESNDVSLSKIKENLTASRVMSPINIHNQIKEVSNENSESSQNSSRNAIPHLQIEFDSKTGDSAIKGEESPGFTDISPIFRMSIDEFASYSAIPDFKIELTRTMSHEDLDSRKERRISLEIPSKRIFRFESFDDKKETFAEENPFYSRNVQEDQVIREIMNEDGSERDSDKIDLKNDPKGQLYEIGKGQENAKKKIEIFVDEPYKNEELVKSESMLKEMSGITATDQTDKMDETGIHENTEENVPINKIELQGHSDKDRQIEMSGIDFHKEISRNDCKVEINENDSQLYMNDFKEEINEKGSQMNMNDFKVETNEKGSQMNMNDKDHQKEIKSNDRQNETKTTENGYSKTLGKKPKPIKENQQVSIIEYPVDFAETKTKIIKSYSLKVLHKNKTEKNLNIEEENISKPEETAPERLKIESTPIKEEPEDQEEALNPLDYPKNLLDIPRKLDTRRKVRNQLAGIAKIEIKTKEKPENSNITHKKTESTVLVIDKPKTLGALSDIDYNKSLEESPNSLLPVKEPTRKSLILPKKPLVSKTSDKFTESDKRITFSQSSKMRKSQYLKKIPDLHRLKYSVESTIIKPIKAKDIPSEDLELKTRAVKRPKTSLSQVFMIKSLQTKTMDTRGSLKRRQLSQVQVGSSVTPKTAASASREFRKSPIFKKRTTQFETKKQSTSSNSKKRTGSNDNKKQSSKTTEGRKRTYLPNADISVASQLFPLKEETANLSHKCNESVLNHSKLILSPKKNAEDCFEYYCRTIGHPYSDIDLLNFTAKSTDFTPSQVIQAGLKLGLDVSEHQFKSSESDLLWIPYLQLAVQPPSFETEDKNSYFVILLEFHRKRKVMKDLPIQRLIELSWLKFQRKDGKKYFFNFFTHEKIESLLKEKEETNKYEKFYMVN